MTKSEINAALIAKWMQEDNYEDLFLEPYKCYCSCEECRERERKTGQKPDCEYYTEED